MTMAWRLSKRIASRKMTRWDGHQLACRESLEKLCCGKCFGTSGGLHVL